MHVEGMAVNSLSRKHHLATLKLTDGRAFGSPHRLILSIVSDALDIRWGGASSVFFGNEGGHKYDPKVELQW